jgi:2-polyprenyl-6-methoxyphenol hydroxylase and related FAD-dependent oxidoreductases
VSTAKPLHVLIAGGGLSGLALAQGLIKDGHTCEVFERDADDTRKIGYYLHMNADGGEALRRCLPEDLFELYAQTSRRTYDRRESVVLDDQLNELSSQPHLGRRTTASARTPGCTGGPCAPSCEPGSATRSTPASPSPATKRHQAKSGHAGRRQHGPGRRPGRRGRHPLRGPRAEASGHHGHRHRRPRPGRLRPRAADP